MSPAQEGKETEKFQPCLPACPESRIRAVKTEESRTSRNTDFYFVKRVLKRSCIKSDASAPRLLSRLSTMSVLQRLAERLFQRAGPCLGDSSGGEGGYYQSQEESEASCWSE